MRSFLQTTMIFGLALLLAIGPGWCRMHCQAASASGIAGSGNFAVASCCQASRALASSTAASHTAEHPSPGIPSSEDCRCQVRPVTNEVRLVTVEVPSLFLIADWLSVEPLGLGLLPKTTLTQTHETPPVPIHVLKCVWRC